MRFGWIILGAAVTSLLICSPANAERFSDPIIGLSIDKPRGWETISAKVAVEDRRNVESNNPQLRAANSDYELLFEFARSRNLHGHMTATVKVGTYPANDAQGLSGEQALQSKFAADERKLSDLKVVTAPETVTLAGRAAGHVALTFTLKDDGASVPIASEMWAVPVGKYFLVVGAVYHPDDSTERAEVMSIVNSLEFTEPPAAAGKSSN